MINTPERILNQKTTLTLCYPKIRLSHQPPGLTGPFKIIHSYLNQDPDSPNAGILSILLLKVKAIGNHDKDFVLLNN